MGIIFRFGKKKQIFFLTCFPKRNIHLPNRKPNLMNRIEIDIHALSDKGRTNLLVWADRWRISPGEAAVRLLDAAARQRRQKKNEEKEEAA
jgi:hypothetical protein